MFIIICSLFYCLMMNKVVSINFKNAITIQVYIVHYIAGVLYEVCFYKLMRCYYFAMYQSLFKKQASLILSLSFLVVVASLCVCRMPFCLCGSYKNNQEGELYFCNRYAAFNFHVFIQQSFFSFFLIILYIMYIGYRSCR